MTNIEIIENKISSIQKYLKILQNYKKISLKNLEKDETIRGAVERYLYLAVQAAIDLAEAVISFKNLRKPTIYSETFEILSEEKIIPANLKEKLVKMAGFRNILAHDYGRINLKIVDDVLKNRLTDIEEFMKNIKKNFKI